MGVRIFFFFWLKFFFFFWIDPYFHRDPIIMIPHSPRSKIFSSRSYFSLCFEALLAWNRNRPFSTLFELSFSVPEHTILLHVGFQVAIRMIEVALPMVGKQMCLVQMSSWRHLYFVDNNNTYFTSTLPFLLPDFLNITILVAISLLDRLFHSLLFF